MKKRVISILLAILLLTSMVPFGGMAALAEEEPIIVECLYLDVEKGAYIDTGFRPTQNTRVVMDVDVTSNMEYWFGVWDGDYDDRAFAFGNDGKGIYAGYSDQGGTFGEVVPPGRHLVELDKKEVKVGGEVKNTFKPKIDQFSLKNTLYLFLQNRKGEAVCMDTQGTIRCYSCQIYEDGILEYDFVPAMCGDTAGLLDRETNEFYSNQGKGNMTAARKSFVDETLSLLAPVPDRYAGVTFLPTEDALTKADITMAAVINDAKCYAVGTGDDALTLTAANDAKIQAVYLKKSAPDQPQQTTTGTTRTQRSLVAVGAMHHIVFVARGTRAMCDREGEIMEETIIASDLTDSTPATPASDSTDSTPAICATNGQVLETEDGYYLTGVNAASTTITPSAETCSLASVEVIYSLPMTGEEIIAAINAQGEDYLARKEAWNIAANALDSAAEEFDPALRAYDAYTQAQDAWDQAKAAYTPANEAYNEADAALTEAHNAYVDARDAYQSVYAQGKVDLAARGEDNSLPEEIPEDTSIAPSGTAIQTVAAPGLLTPKKETFTKSKKQSDYLALEASLSLNAFELRKTKSIKLSASNGAKIRSLDMYYLEHYPSSPPPISYFRTDPSCKLSQNGNVYSIFVSDVGTDTLTISSTISTVYFSEIKVDYLAPLTTQEIISEINSKGEAFAKAKNDYAKALSDFNTAKANFDLEAAKYNTAAAEFEKAENEWLPFSAEYDAFNAIKAAHDRAEKKYNYALTKYTDIYERGIANLDPEGDLPVDLTQEDLSLSGSVLSQGSMTVVLVIAVLAAGLLTFLLLRKKRISEAKVGK